MDAKPETYPVVLHGRKARVTVPERHDHVAYEGEPADILRDLMKDNMSPQAVAALANAARLQLNATAPILGDTAWRVEVEWVANALIAALGGEEAYHRICREAGF